MCNPEGIVIAHLRHRLSTLDRVKLDAYFERMVEALIESARFTFGPQKSIEFIVHLRMSGEAFMGETGIRVSLESQGEMFSQPVDKTAPLGQRPPTPSWLGGHYIVGEKPK